MSQALAFGSLLATGAGAAMNYSASRQQQKAAEAQADYEKAQTDARVKEERSRLSQNLLRAQEEKRKAISRQRAAFVKAGVLPESASADFVIGELGENLQTRIQDLFVQQGDRIASIQSQGQSRYWNAMQNASAASRQATGSLISGFGRIGGQAYDFHRSGAFNFKRND